MTTIYVATNEPNGSHHTRELATAAAQRDDVTLVHLVADPTQVQAAHRDRVATIDQVQPGPGDVLVVNGASHFPADCATHPKFANTKVVASSLAYLAPQQMPRSQDFTGRLVAVTAPGEAEADSFRTAMGLSESHPVKTVGSVHTDGMPQWEPQGQQVGYGSGPVRPKVLLIGNSVGRTPGAELTYWAGMVLKDAGYDVVVKRHPGDTATYPGLAIDDDSRPVDAAATADYIVGGPGSVLGPMAALGYDLPDGTHVGPKIVGIVPPDFHIPDHLRDLCSEVVSDDLTREWERQGRPGPSAEEEAARIGPSQQTTDRHTPEVITLDARVPAGQASTTQTPELALQEAMKNAKPASTDAIRRTVGPVDGLAAQRILDTWVRAAQGMNADEIEQLRGVTAGQGVGVTTAPVTIDTAAVSSSAAEQAAARKPGTREL